MSEPPTALEPDEVPPGMARATFGTGCFWCTEAVFQQLKGVQSVVSGYSGGSVKNPTYRQVCTGTTGHAEAIQVTYDPSAISYEELLEVFWQTHDPTTSAIVVKDTETSLRFYRDRLGLRIVGASENFGTEQEHLNNVFGARLRITTLRAAKGPAIELLEYLTRGTAGRCPG